MRPDERKKRNCLHAIALALAVGSGPLQAATPSLCLGMGINVGNGTEYVPYEKEIDFSIDPAIELAVFLGKNHRVGTQFMLMNASDALVFPNLEERAQKLSLNYGYQVLSHIFVGPHAFIKFGENEFAPLAKILPIYTGSLRDEYRLTGGGMTLYAELLKHLSFQCYVEYNHELKHERWNDTKDNFEGTALEFPSGKSSNWNSGLIFSVKI